MDTVGSEWSAVYRKMDYEKFFREYDIIDEVEERQRRRDLIKDEDHTKILTFTKEQGFYDNWLLHHIPYGFSAFFLSHFFFKYLRKII